MASHQNATCRTDARTLTVARLHCVAVPTGGDVDCAVAELTDALIGCRNHDGAIIVAATAGCGEGACWVEGRVMGIITEKLMAASIAEGDESAPLVVNA